MFAIPLSGHSCLVVSAISVIFSLLNERSRRLKAGCDSWLRLAHPQDLFNPDSGRQRSERW